MRPGLFVAALLLLLPTAAVTIPSPKILPMPVPAGFTETTLATGMSRPVALRWLTAGRLLIAQQGSPNGSSTATALIRVFQNGALQATPYATISSATLGNVYRVNNESGLLGLAVDPNFATNGYVYIYCTFTTATSEHRIYRYTTVMSGTDTIGTSPTLMVGGIPSGGANHNGGGLVFDDQGRLLVCVGDGGAGGTPANAQNGALLWGKILRYDVSTVPATPAGSGTGGWNAAVWTIGHRHPFRITTRPTSPQQIFEMENGTSMHDEINPIAPGNNYGWPNNEGPNSPPYTSPTWSTGAAGVIAMTDGAFYPTSGGTMPFAGDLFYVGYSANTIYRATVNAAGTAFTAGPFGFVTGISQPVDVEVGPDGALYYCTLLGGLYKAQANGTGNLAPFASFTAAPTLGTPPMLVNVDSAGSYDLDGSISTRVWDWGDGTPTSTGVTQSHSYATMGTKTITLTVTDNLGATGTSTQNVYVTVAGNTPPSAHIESQTETSPLSMTFVGHGHDTTPGDTLEHRWNYGDGSPIQTVTGQAPDANSTVVHAYAAAGTYTVTLTVEDTGFLTAVHSTSVTVTGAPPPPPPPPPGGGGGGGHGGCGLLGIEPLLLAALLLAVRRR